MPFLTARRVAYLQFANAYCDSIVGVGDALTDYFEGYIAPQSDDGSFQQSLMHTYLDKTQITPKA